MEKTPTAQTPAAGWLRPDGAARYLSISRRCLGSLTRERVLPFVRLSHRVILFRRQDLDRALARRLVKAVGE